MMVIASSPVLVSSRHAALQRNNRDHPCLVCRGHADLPKGRGQRCAGFTLDRVSYCTREQYAGRLPLDLSTSPPAYRHSLSGACGCGQQHGEHFFSPGPFPNTSTQPERPERTSIGVDVRHFVYSLALSLLDLREEALDDLIGRGLSIEAIDSAGYKSIPHKGTEHRRFMAQMVEMAGEESLRRCPGFTDKNGRLGFWTASGTRDGYVVPYRDEPGFITGIQQKVLGGKYLTARGSILSSVYHVDGTGGPGDDLYITEGAVKATVASHLGDIWTFAVAGQSLNPQHIDVIKRLNPGRVIVALDQENNANTARAREHWTRMLWEQDLPVFRAIWEGEDLGGAKGLDDLLLRGDHPRIRQVCQVPSEMGRARRPQTVSSPGPVDAGQSLEEVREITRRSVKDFVGHPQRNQGKSQLIKTSPGSGKTTAVAQTLRETGRTARILVGTKNLAAELAAEHGYTLIEGRSRDNCERFDVVEALRDGGHRIGKLACGTPSKPLCPERGSCPYWAQYQSLGTWVAPAELLFNPRYLEDGDVVVIDDADLSRSLVERFYLASDSIDRALEQLKGKRWREVRQILTIVSHALVDAPRYENGPGGPALLGPVVWDHLVGTACRYGTDLPTLIGALPEVLKFPKPRGKGAKNLTAEDVEAVPSVAVVRLLDALVEELESFQAREDFNSRIRLSTAGIDIWKLRDLPKKDAEGKDPAHLPLLILDATPVEVLVEHLTQRHTRLPDVTASIRLPENVTVVQYAASSNGHAVLGDAWRRQQVADQVANERQNHPVPSSDREAVICFRSQKDSMEGLGFPASQVLTFGSARGSNALANVERLHVIGRPMPPGDELVYLAQVLHHDNDIPVSGQIELRRPKYGGQRYEVPVVDFVDPRVSGLLHARREDELLQVLHRARLTTLAPQEYLIGLGSGYKRRQVRLVLHTNHPVPGLRVDQLILDPPKTETNDVRQQDAVNRILAAVDRLRQRRKPVTVTAVAQEASANKATVSKVLGQRYIPLENNLYKGMYRVPKTSDGREDIPPETREDLFVGEIDPAPEPTLWEEEL